MAAPHADTAVADETSVPVHRPLSGRFLSAPVWILNASLLAIAVVLYTTKIRDLSVLPTALQLEWWQLAILFCAAEICVVHVHLRRDAHSFSLSEIPYVLGLVFARPSDLVVGQLVGLAVALVLVRRQSPLKLVFNISHFLVETCVLVIVFRFLMNAADPLGMQSWLAIFVAATAVILIGVASIAAAISLSEWAFEPQRWVHMLTLSLASGLTNTSVGLAVAATLRADPRTAILLILPIAVLFVAYRAFISERHRHEQMNFLLEAGRIINGSRELDGALVELLDHARQTLRAETAELTLFPSHESESALRTIVRSNGDRTIMQPTILAAGEMALAKGLQPDRGILMRRGESNPDLAWFIRDRGSKDMMLVGLVGETRILGTIALTDRLGEVSTFDDADLRLFETLASQVSTGLQNGQLEQSLARLTELQDQLSYQAFHDPLTGLANRALFSDRVEHGLARCSRSSSSLAVLFLDLDDFKSINDNLGHAAGDMLLTTVASRIETLLRPSDTAARLGGDEFAVLVEGVQDVQDVTIIAGRIIEAVRCPITLGEVEVSVAASIGISITEGGATVEELLRHADVAMYNAKASGKACAEVYSPDMHAALVERHSVGADLHHAIERDELTLAYQPLVSTTRGQLLGVEVLVRWQHPERGLIMPDDFIPFAEESGLIVDLGWHVLRRACEQWVRWNRDLPGHPRLLMSVNLSGRQLDDRRISQIVQEIMEETGMDPRCLMLEVTESVMIRDPHMTARQLQQLKGAGVMLALDDFGTGYSSLRWLRDLPIDVLKIARPFVEHIEEGGEHEALAEAIIRLGESLGMVVVAEGVETAEQRDHLRRLGCTLAQGFFFARPDFAGAMTEMIITREMHESLWKRQNEMTVRVSA